MRVRFTGIAAALAVLIGVTPALAQQSRHIATAETMRQAVAGKVQQDKDTRAALRELLQKDEVRQVAATAGLDVRAAERAVATLTPDELTRLADPVRTADAVLAGGSGTIVISTTTALLILIIVILIVD